MTLVGRVESTASWKALEVHHASVSRMMHAPNLFSSNPSRFAEFSAKFEDLLVDYSKNAASAETMDLLCGLAAEADILGKARAMCSGKGSTTPRDAPSYTWRCAIDRIHRYTLTASMSCRA
jgi:hypothetical protein